jgi:hypothetical protein
VEVWLRNNVRALAFGTVLPTIVALLGVGFLAGWPVREPPLWLRIVGGVLFAFGAASVAGLVALMRQPRLAYADRHLLVWLRSGPPLRVPIEVVECFWLGQALGMLPGRRHANTETASVVVRIADSAAEWRHQEVKPRLGTWCEGYITIRGTWCEPLSIQLVNRLNQRLAEVTRTAPVESKNA